MIRRLWQLPPDVQIYLIAGPTGSGKTTLARLLSGQLSAILMSQDDYFRDEDEVEMEYSQEFGESPQWDSPRACDLDLLIMNIRQLVAEGRTHIPQFSFSENRRFGYCLLEKRPEQPIIVEGLHAIMCKEPLSRLGFLTFSVFVTADETTRLGRIRLRDSIERGRSDALLARRFHFIKLAETRWIMKQRDAADLIIDTTLGLNDC